MRSTVKEMYDYRSEPVPEELLSWRVSDEEVREQLAVLSRAYARESTVEQVGSGDAVRCVCMDGTGLPGRSSVLLYPGRALPGAEEAELAVMGKIRRETFSTVIGGTGLTLRVEEICRRCPAEVNDTLVRQAGIEGVETVEAYAAWYRENTEPVRKRDAIARIISYWVQKAGKSSQLSVDEEERAAWAMEQARQNYAAMAADGQDPCIPEDGFDFLTEEQALRQMAERIAPNFDLVVTVRYMVNQRGIVLEGADLERRYMNQIFELLTPEAERLLEV